MSGCYPGCFYYTDSCFRKDCKNMIRSQAHKPAHGGYPDIETPKDRVTDFRAIAAAAYPETQAQAIAGGLQPHSVGDIYPFAVVGYETGSGTVYCIENLASGLAAARWSRVFRRHTRCCWLSAADAEQWFRYEYREGDDVIWKALPRP